jgi:hypothetical protein
MAGDESSRGVVCLRRDPLGVVGKPEVDVPQLRREVEAGGRRMPPRLREDPVAPDELTVFLADQQATPAEVANGPRMLDLGPVALRNREQDRERVRLERCCLAGQGRGDERRIAFAVDEEKRRSANARQRLARPGLVLLRFRFHPYELRGDRRWPWHRVGRLGGLRRLWLWGRLRLGRLRRLFLRAARHGISPSSRPRIPFETKP